MFLLQVGQPSRKYHATTDLILDRPFLQQDLLTPASSSTSRSVSPLDGSRSPFGKPMRSATTPLHMSPPSPDVLSSNLDCAFPPFPVAPPVPANNNLQPGGDYGSMGKDPNIMYAPLSPRNASSGGLLKRMNTIAPGPFNVNQKGSLDRDEKNHQRQVTLGSSREITRSASTPDVVSSVRRPSTAGSGNSHTSTNSSNGAGLQRSPRKNGYGGFGPPQSELEENKPEPLRQEQRSQTFPLNSQDQDSMKRRLEPAPRIGTPSNAPAASERSTSGSPPRQRKQSVSGPILSRPLPPRGASLIRPRNGAKPGEIPPIPTNINLAAEFGIGNPYHTPSESQSSDASGYSQESRASSRSSPSSAMADRPQRKPSDTSQLDGLISEVQASMMDLQPKFIPSEPEKHDEQFARNMLAPRNLDPSLLNPESPMDPAIQDGRLSPVPPRAPARNPARTALPGSPPNQQPARRPATAKGDCKACRAPIKGKSVSSADGRLTGRYHKQCFVCTTCSEPFQTSTFYVINDAPYCERHYHKLNGSVCTACDKGIEGQYLESERKQKFHPRCLTCADCRRTLRNDYFEMNGRVYCERDAFRRAQQGRFLGPGGGGTNRMERRTTRLMMM
jgi:hypothetical protein